MALLLTAALGWGLSLLIQRGRLTWPPLALLSSLSTLAGCLAAGRTADSGSLRQRGEPGRTRLADRRPPDLALRHRGRLQGSSRTLNWATPLGDRTMGLAILAVLLAGWRCGLASRDWSWTNVIGWALGLFWVALAVGSWFLMPAAGLGVWRRADP